MAASLDDPVTEPIFTIWVVRAGPGAEFAHDFRELQMAALASPPLHDVAGMETSEIVDLICAERPTPRPRAIGIAAMLHRFVVEVQVGDLVVTPTAMTSALMLGEVTGPYQFRREFVEAPHSRDVAWRQTIGRQHIDPSLLPKIGAPMPFFRPAAQKPLQALFRTRIQ